MYVCLANKARALFVIRGMLTATYILLYLYIHTYMYIRKCISVSTSHSITKKKIVKAIASLVFG